MWGVGCRAYVGALAIAAEEGEVGGDGFGRREAVPHPQYVEHHHLQRERVCESERQRECVRVCVRKRASRRKSERERKRERERGCVRESVCSQDTAQPPICRTPPSGPSLGLGFGV